MGESVPEMADLGSLVKVARLYPGTFLAGWFSAKVEEELAARLVLDRLRMQRLLLCRRPRSLREVTRIACYVGVSAAELAAALRESGIPGI